MHMNHKSPEDVSVPASAERKNSRLIQEFVRSAKAERDAIYSGKITAGEALTGLCDLFGILLERSGYSLINEAYTQNYWQDVRNRMAQYLRSVGGLKSLAKTEEDLHLNEWAADKVAEYGRLVHGPAPLAQSRGGFGANLMRYFR